MSVSTGTSQLLRRTGSKVEPDRQNRTGRTGQTKQDRQNRTNKTGQTEQNRQKTGKKGLAEHRTTRKGLPNRAARTVLTG
jgi:hypothetical protein